MNKLTHTDTEGKAVMVDIGTKIIQQRVARAAGSIMLAPETIKLLKENSIKKGDALTVAQLAGIASAKKTSELIPLCHNILLENIKVELKVTDSGVSAESEVRTTGKTGVEMEALTAVSLALLTVYDMCKAVDKQMVISEIRLTEKLKL
ncbi:MAG TPA: cyclic pyranopterin monophosphate synthase MoaC [Bacteroidales bacterium]|nr:cyclic pyranopterin monophosphate synthase MoaC [Bacteroidales bacterium]